MAQNCPLKPLAHVQVSGATQVPLPPQTCGEVFGIPLQVKNSQFKPERVELQTQVLMPVHEPPPLQTDGLVDTMPLQVGLWQLVPP